MAILVQKTFTTICNSELLTTINADGNIVPELLQILTDAGFPTLTNFWFDVALSGSEDTYLNGLLAGWLCPTLQSESGKAILDDTGEPNTDTIWSSQQITNNFANIGTTITGGGLITGGGDISTNRVLTLNNSDIDHNQTTNFNVNQHIDHTLITLTAGSGLTGGGNITTNRSFDVNIQNSIEISADALQLVNDVSSPGNTKLYGTDGLGVRGWYDQPSGASPIFGSYFQQASSDKESSTNSIKWIEKMRMTTQSLPFGTYRIGWYTESTSNQIYRSTQIQVQINDTVTICEFTKEPQDITDWISFSGMYYHTGSGVLDIDVDFKTLHADTAGRIRRVRLDIWRIN